LILKDKKAFDEIARSKLFESFFAGYWTGATFRVEKDRMYGAYDHAELSPVQLVEHVNKLQKILATQTKS
jgi:hypothetical protein